MIRLLSLLLGVLGTATVAGCGGKCSGMYNCPNSGKSYQFAPSGLSAPLAEVSSDPPCTATLPSLDGGLPEISVTADPSVGTTVCQLYGRLLDGTAVTSTVTFQPADLGCCPSFTATGGSFTLSDAGLDGH